MDKNQKLPKVNSSDCQVHAMVMLARINEKIDLSNLSKKILYVSFKEQGGRFYWDCYNIYLSARVLSDGAVEECYPGSVWFAKIKDFKSLNYTKKNFLEYEQA